MKTERSLDVPGLNINRQPRQQTFITTEFSFYLISKIQPPHTTARISTVLIQGIIIPNHLLPKYSTSSEYLFTTKIQLASSLYLNKSWEAVRNVESYFLCFSWHPRAVNTSPDTRFFWYVTITINVHRCQHVLWHTQGWVSLPWSHGKECHSHQKATFQPKEGYYHGMYWSST